METSRLITSLKDTFINQDKFQMDKHVPEFKQEGKFLGDFFNVVACEPLGDRPPRFYHKFSPFDVISNTAPQYAVVFEAGELLLNIEFDSYITLRTAAMNVLLLEGLGIKNLDNRKVLLFGSGKVASATVKMLASELGLKEIDVINRSGDLTKIQKAAKESGVNIKAGDIKNLSSYDLIICHTQSSETLIPKESLREIKKGAIVASFITSTEHGEIADDFYDSSKANIIVDWENTILGAKDMQRAKESRLFNESELIHMKDLLDGTKSLDESKDYTVYRSSGSPVQDVAILKELINSK